MEKGRKALLKRVPTRKLLASIKKDLRQEIRVTRSEPKPNEK
jgi:hypothetical protein